jgi:hypothetical protein
MRSPVQRAGWLLPFLWLQPFLLTGCIFHKNQPVPVQAFAPSIQPSIPLEIASIELPPVFLVVPARPIYNMKLPAEPLKQPVHRRRPVSKPVEVSPDVAVANPIPAVNAIGQLSSGDPSNYHQQIEEVIATTEHGLNSIGRPLDDQEQKTADHIREDIKQAKAALASGDLDGAHTLAAKAKVLLDELKK